MTYDVSTASRAPLKTRLEKTRKSLSRGSGIAIFLSGGTQLNPADLKTIQALGKPRSAGGLDLPKLSRLYIYNLRALPAGRECTTGSGLACAGQRSYGGLQPLLWYNGWWDSWVANLSLDDLRTVKAGAFSNTNFASISLRSVRSVGVMGFGHGPRSRLTQVYLPSATSIGKDAFRRNQNLVKVSLPRVTKIDDYAFDDADRLETFSAPKMVTIGRNALNDAHALRSVNFASVEYIGINCFDGNGDAQAGTGIKELRLPRLTELDDNAIVGLNSLKYIYAPRLKVAAPGAMSRNQSLEKVYAPRLTSRAPNTFENDPKLKELIIPGR